MPVSRACSYTIRRQKPRAAGVGLQQCGVPDVVLIWRRIAVGGPILMSLIDRVKRIWQTQSIVFKHLGGYHILCFFGKYFLLVRCRKRQPETVVSPSAVLAHPRTKRTLDGCRSRDSAALCIARLLPAPRDVTCVIQICLFRRSDIGLQMGL